MSAAKCETRWGDSLSTQAVPEGRDHPTPLALRAIDLRASYARPGPLQGRVSARVLPGASHYLNPRFPRLGTSSCPRLNFASHPSAALRCTMLT
ncbi:hypothetical protein ABH994_000551 [Bradyrhizobium yuanmingense]